VKCLFLFIQRRRIVGHQIALSVDEVLILILILSLRSAISVAFSGLGESAFCQRCRCCGCSNIAARCTLLQRCHTQDSRTPLQWAAAGGHIDVVTYLLENGAEVDKVDDGGWTALHIAGVRDWHRTVCL
jgi:ankyrin repeat protein